MGFLLLIAPAICIPAPSIPLPLPPSRSPSQSILSRSLARALSPLITPPITAVWEVAVGRHKGGPRRLRHPFSFRSPQNNPPPPHFWPASSCDHGGNRRWTR